jgi:hypothetical protein
MGDLLPTKPTNDPEAIKANIAHNFITQRGFEAVKAMVMVGKILWDKKQQLGHGRWIPWCEENLVFSYKTASNYMRLYDNRVRIFDVQPESLLQAIRLILEDSKPKRITPGLLSADHKILHKNL